MSSKFRISAAACLIALFGAEARAQTATAPAQTATAPAQTARPAQGGTIMVNISAPITSETMLELVRVAQDSVALGVDAVQINLSSSGGRIGAARFAVNALSALPVRIETVAMSDVSSAAVALFCAGERRYMGEGASIYLHQLTRFAELSRKTATALLREDEIVQGWYDGVLQRCLNDDADRAEVDYSASDVILDAAAAERLGMVTDAFNNLKSVRPFGRATNIVARDQGASAAR